MSFAKVLQTVTDELHCVPQIQGVTIESVPGRLSTDAEQMGETIVEGDRVWISWTEDLGARVERSGRDVVLMIREDSDHSELGGALISGLLSVVAGACLNLQGQVAIHANGVAIDGQAIGFVGYSGMGKSTLSTYCISRGSKLITDDVLMVDAAGSVHPGNSRVKLYPHTAEQLGLDANIDTDYKIYYHPSQLGTVLLQQPAPLRNLYLLAEGDRIYSEALSPSQAVFELLTHSYYASSLIPANPRLLDAYTRLVSQVAVKRLYYPRQFADLPKVYDLLCRELMAVCA